MCPAVQSLLRNQEKERIENVKTLCVECCSQEKSRTLVPSHCSTLLKHAYVNTFSKIQNNISVQFTEKYNIYTNIYRPL